MVLFRCSVTGSAALWLLLLVAFQNTVLAQGVNPPIVMHTGTGASLSSQSFSFTSTTGTTGSSFLNFNFGLATDEQPQPGVFPDSFTISITGPDGTAYLATLDAVGTHWTPVVPGALPVDTTALTWQSSPFLASTEGLTNLASYAVSYSLPANWQGVPLNVNFDLFDNQNGLPSLGYYTVPVPEPAVPTLFLMAFVLWRRLDQGHR